MRTENVVGRSDSAAKAFVDAGGVSSADAGSLIAFLMGGKWEYWRRFFFPGADTLCARRRQALRCTLTSLRDAIVAAMQAADLGDGNHSSPPRRLDDARERSVVVQSAVGSRIVVIIEVAGQGAPEVGLVENDQMIWTFASD